MQESKVPSSIETRIFTPTVEQLQNFRDYVEYLDDQGLSFAVIKTPPGFNVRSKAINDETILNSVKNQSTKPIRSSKCSVLLNSDTPKITYSKYRNLAKKMEEQYGKLSIEELEDVFWQRKNENETLYSVDNEFSLFPDDLKTLNLNRFTVKESLIHHPDADIIPGINTPYLYIGSIFSIFALHLEDGNLYSINYNHSGKPKFWYFIPESENLKLEKLSKKLLNNYECDFLIRHKLLLVPPSVLTKHGIRFARVIQNPGDFVISLVGGYHQGFNLGFNHAEAVNFTGNRWLPYFGSFKMCSCPFNSGARLTYNSLKKIIDHGKDDDFVEGHDDSHHIFTKTIHMRNHLPTRESNRQKYTCAYPECSKQYYELKNWRRHFLKIHTKHEKGDSAKKKKLQKFERKLKKQPVLSHIPTWQQRFDELEQENSELRSKINQILKIRIAKKITKKYTKSLMLSDKVY